MTAENRSSRSLLPWFLGVTVACLATGGAASEPTQLPALEPVTIEVDLSSLPAGEKAALARIVHAGPLMDDLYICQVWPETAGFMKERESAQNPSAQSELAALNFFKGPWDNQGVPFIAGVPAKQPIGDFYPANSSKADIDSEVTRAAGEFVSLMAKADLVAIEALLGRYVTVSPEVAAVLKRIGADPPPPRIVYRTADQLDPP